MKKACIIFSTTMLLVAGCQPPPVKTQKPDYETEFEMMILETADNYRAFVEKYVGKTIKVTGAINNVGYLLPHIEGLTDLENKHRWAKRLDDPELKVHVIFSQDKDKGPLYAVMRCDLADKKNIDKYFTRQRITVIGRLEKLEPRRRPWVEIDPVVGASAALFLNPPYAQAAVAVAIAERPGVMYFMTDCHILTPPPPPGTEPPLATGK
jgi:hypothetical protein